MLLFQQIRRESDEVCTLLYLAAEVTRHVLRCLREGEEGGRGILAHRLLQLVNLLRDVTKSSLREKRGGSYIRESVLCDDHGEASIFVGIWYRATRTAVAGEGNRRGAQFGASLARNVTIAYIKEMGIVFARKLEQRSTTRALENNPTKLHRIT